MAEITVYCDGACEPCNPGGYATWAWVAFVNGLEVNHAYGCLGQGEGMTNNVAEYESVLQALRRAQSRQVAIHLKTDSQLVVKQTLQEWQVRQSTLGPLVSEAQLLLNETQSTIAWIPREQNERADEYTRIAYAQARKERIRVG